MRKKKCDTSKTDCNEKGSEGVCGGNTNNKSTEREKKFQPRIEIMTSLRLSKLFKNEIHDSDPSS